MKGRHTSFQRFGSVLGASGSVTNKFFRSTNVRDSDLAGKSQSDTSMGKGIYNLTIKSTEDLEFVMKDVDMGEEVYGCISNGFGSKQALEQEDNAKDQRKVKRKDSKHFKDEKHSWYNIKADEEYKDCALIPQENIPLVANSKFEIKYWNGTKAIEIPAGAGFTSGTLVRPVAFSTKAGKISNGFRHHQYAFSHTLKAVPIHIAHAMLHRCKEMSLTGSVNYSVERTNKQCSGSQTSVYKYTAQTNGARCGPGACTDAGGSITLTCASTKQTTQVVMSGDFGMTAYRHKQLTDIWSEAPKTLDISGNYLYGSLAEAGLMKVSHYTCDELIDDEGGGKTPMTLIEQIAKFEKQTVLSSGCLAYPTTNNSLLNATLEDNLKEVDGPADNCSEGYTYYTLDAGENQSMYALPQINTALNYFPANIYPSGVSTTVYGGSGSAVCPEFASGPSLCARFVGNGFDFSGVGVDGPQDAYLEGACGQYAQNFTNWKGIWHNTGITRKVEGSCPLGMGGLARYDGGISKNCKCDDPCSSCKNDYGKLRLICDCQPLCTSEVIYPTPLAEPCKGQIKGGCDCGYNFHMEIGKYVGVEIDDVFKVYRAAAIPLSTKMDTKEEDLTIWFNGEISQLDANMNGFDRPLTLTLNQESAQRAHIYGDDSVTRWEEKEIGKLTIICDSWTQEVPLFGTWPVSKATTCKGVAFATNTYGTSKDAGNTHCAGCEDENEDRCCDPAGCSGKGGVPDGCCNSVYCDIADPCVYGVSQVSSIPGCNQPACSGTCDENDDEDCNGCCNDCGDVSEGCTEPCKDFKKCAGFNLVSDFEEMGCYGDAHEEDKHQASANLTLTFKLFTEMV